MGQNSVLIPFCKSVRLLYIMRWFPLNALFFSTKMLIAPPPNNSLKYNLPNNALHCREAFSLVSTLTKTYIQYIDVFFLHFQFFPEKVIIFWENSAKMHNNA